MACDLGGVMAVEELVADGDESTPN